MPKKLILLIPLLFYFLFFIFYFNLPFVGPYGHSHLQYSIAARSYLESGWQKFIPYVWPNQAYLNHPPLLYILLTVFYKFFGFHDFIGRLMPFLFSLGSALFFYLIIKKYFGKKIAFYSLFFYLTFPMFLFYGAFLQFEPLVLFFSLGTFYFLDKYLEKDCHPEGAKRLKDAVVNLVNRTRFFAMFTLSGANVLRMTFLLIIATCYLLLATISDFSGFIFAGLIIFYLIFKKRRWLAFFLFILNTLYLILYTHYLSSVGFPLSSLLSAYFSRATLKEIFNIGFLLRFFFVIFLRLLIYFSPLSIFCLLFPSSIFYLPSSGSKKIMTILFLFPVLNSLLLAGGTLTHPYFLFFFIPIMALFCGYLVFKVNHLGWWRGNDLDSSEVNSFILSPPRSPFGPLGGAVSTLLSVHLFFSLFIFSLKIYQIKKFSWQYQVAIKTAEIIGQDKVFYKNWALDRELFYWYGKKMPIEIYPLELLALKKYQANYYLFVCFPQCHKSDHKFLENLSKKFTWQKINVAVPSYIFNLKEGPKKEKIIEVKEEIKSNNCLDFLKRLRSLLRIEQL